MYELLTSQIKTIPALFNLAYSQILLFVIGIVVAVFFGIVMQPFVCTLEGLLWYMVGMIVPLFPSMIGLEVL